MPRVELKLKQASAVLDVAPKELQNLVQAGVFRLRRHGKAYYFSRDTLLQAKRSTSGCRSRTQLKTCRGAGSAQRGSGKGKFQTWSEAIATDGAGQS